jgi:hypothetical protein
VDIGDDFYTVEETAKVLNRTPGRVRQMLREGTLDGEGGGEAKGPWRVYKRSVHALRDEAPRRRSSGHGEHSKMDAEASSDLPPAPQESPSEARELRERIEALQRELGRLEGRLELTEVAESTIRESLERERERADVAELEVRTLRKELEQARRSRWRRLFGR